MPDRDAPVDEVVRGRPLVRVVGEDAAERHLQGPPQVGVDAGTGLLDLALGDPQAVGHVHPVQLGGGPDDGGVALGADGGEDARHRVVHVRPRCRRARQGGVERRLRAAQVQDTEGHETTQATGGPSGSPPGSGVGPALLSRAGAAPR